MQLSFTVINREISEVISNFKALVTSVELAQALLYISALRPTRNHTEVIMLKTIRISLLLILTTVAFGCATADDLSFAGESVGSTSDASTTRGQFELWRGADDQFYFHLQAANNEILLSSEGYKARSGAINGILSVLDNGGLAHRYDIFEGADSQFYVNLVAANGEIIGSTEGYTTAQGADRAVTASINAIAGYLEHWATNTGARFNVFESDSGYYYFNLHAKNGEIVLSSEAYESETSALNGAFAVAENGLDEANYDVRAAHGGGYYVNLRAANNEIIATSEVYSTESNARAAVVAMIALIPEAELL